MHVLRHDKLAYRPVRGRKLEVPLFPDLHRLIDQDGAADVGQVVIDQRFVGDDGHEDRLVLAWMLLDLLCALLDLHLHGPGHLNSLWIGKKSMFVTPAASAHTINSV